VPVGGAVGKTLSGDPIILSQPSVGKVVAMSAICPHQGCTVAPADKQLQCPCHQSAFDLSSGEPVVNTATDQMGPAQSGLTTLTATVFQGAVYVSAKG
jgi:Rieske Fe-S protein